VTGLTQPQFCGVIAAIATATDERGSPDLERSTSFARYLLDQGCDGLNVLGTTGEATSFSVLQRQQLMDAYGASGLPLRRLMVGTGAAAVADAVTLARHAAEIGFGAVLVLPPFYYKGVTDDGLIAYLEAIVTATPERPIPILLYHFPQLSGVPWTIPLIRRLLARFGGRIIGLKDSSGDLSYAREAAAIAGDFRVFPSSEAALMEARSGTFAGCISATANLNADLCAQAYRQGDADALKRAVAIRGLFDGKPLIPGVKALIASLRDDPAWARVKPPLAMLASSDGPPLRAAYESVRQGASAPIPAQ